MSATERGAAQQWHRRLPPTEKTNAPSSPLAKGGKILHTVSKLAPHGSGHKPWSSLGLLLVHRDIPRLGSRREQSCYVTLKQPDIHSSNRREYRRAKTPKRYGIIIIARNAKCVFLQVGPVGDRRAEKNILQLVGLILCFRKQFQEAPRVTEPNPSTSRMDGIE